jgi:hypothetical protein
MRDPERLRAVQAVLREKHEKLFALRSAEVVSLRETPDAEGAAVEATRDVFDSARIAFVQATIALQAARATLDIVSEAHDALAEIYEADRELEDIIDTDTP